MANVVKDTKKMKFERILPLVADDEVLTAFIKGEIASLERKAEKANATPTKEQAVMVELMDIVTGAMTALTEPATVSVILHLPDVETFAADKEKFAYGITPQRMTACLHKLIEKGEVKKVTEGKVTKFTLSD